MPFYVQKLRYFSPISVVSLGAVLALGGGGCSTSVDTRAHGQKNTGPAGTVANSVGGSSGSGANSGILTGVGGGAIASLGTGGTPGVNGTCMANASLAQARIWRLTDSQFVNVVKEVFGIAIPPEVSGAMVATSAINLSENQVVTASNIQNYENSAKSAAGTLVGNLAAITPCASAAPDAACTEQFIREKVARAYRRPLENDEVAQLMALYTLGSGESPATGVRLVLEAVLQSPNFIWRTEVGPASPSELVVGSKVTLTPFELAGAVSFFLTEAAPDDALWQKAQDGTLSSASVLTAEVDRLLVSAPTQRVLGEDAGLWVGLPRLERNDKDPVAFPTFTPSAKAALISGTKSFLGDVLQRGSTSDLLTSNSIYLNQELAALYGVSGLTGDNLLPVKVATSERSSGLLSQPGILTAASAAARGDVVHRGLFVLRSVVCGGAIPSPPANAIAVAATLPMDATEKERANFRAGNAMCAGCHALFDPLGLTHENYDAIGRFSLNDPLGKPIDASSTLVGLGADLDGPVNGLNELASRLAATRRPADCAVANLASIALGRDAKLDTSCALQDVKDQVVQAASFAEFFRALLASPAFLTRDVQ